MKTLIKDNPFAERVREVLHYDPLTGIFIWRKSCGSRAKAGAVAGSLDGQGYYRIGIDCRDYAGHRLAWIYVHGQWPVDQLDHIDGQRDNNRFINLRETSSAGNTQNQRKAHKHNRSGLLGVCFRGNTWQARIGANKKLIYLGSFPSAERAHAAYVLAKRELHKGCTI